MRKSVLNRCAVRRASLALSTLAIGCEGAQSVLNPAGPQAAHIGALWWVFFAVSAAVYLLVMAFLGRAVSRSRAAPSEEPALPEVSPEAGREHRLLRAVYVATGLTIAALFALLVYSVATGRALTALSGHETLTVKVIGHQWWWEVRYEEGPSDQAFTTANEIHLPVGRPVLLELTSHDVIHSLWIPNLHGKRDLIPGHVTRLHLQADRPGVYRGQCAEFCGLQHALMALVVVAEPEAAFQRWRLTQPRPAREPANPAQRRGRDVFMQSSCPLCHAIAGTLAGGLHAPDLTHLASRLTLGAATLPNTVGHLGGWIADPQGIKPGNQMPPNLLPASDLQALLAYLESLE